MTAQLIRLYADMPQELSRADLDAATAAHVSAMRPTPDDLARAEGCLIEAQEMHHKRPTQQQVLDAQEIQHTRRWNLRLYAVVAAAIIAGLIIGHAIESAWTVSIAADQAR